MRILVACDLPAEAIDQLRELGGDVLLAPDPTAESIRSQIRDVGIVVVSRTRLPADLIHQAKALQLIVRAGDGPGNVAVDEASQQGVFVTHCPNKRAAAAAELAFGFIIALDRDIVDQTILLREARPTKGAPALARGLAGRNIGILGFGAVGMAIAERAIAFGMTVHAWSSSFTGDQSARTDVQWCHWPRELARRCEIVVVAPSEGGATPVLVDDEFVQNLPAGATLVHVGDPGAMDEAAVGRGIQTKQLRVALDTHGGDGAETGRSRSKLLELPGVIATPRVAGVTAQARDAIAAEVVHVIQSFLVSGEVLNCLNLAERSPAKWQLVLRVRDQVGVMASILEAVRADGINAEEISSRVFTGAKAAWCTIALNERPSAEALDNIRSLQDVLHLELRAVV